jgi:hypothetical protein
MVGLLCCLSRQRRESLVHLGSSSFSSASEPCLAVSAVRLHFELPVRSWFLVAYFRRAKHDVNTARGHAPILGTGSTRQTSVIGTAIGTGTSTTTRQPRPPHSNSEPQATCPFNPPPHAQPNGCSARVCSTCTQARANSRNQTRRHQPVAPNPPQTNTSPTQAHPNQSERVLNRRTTNQSKPTLGQAGRPPANE